MTAVANDARYTVLHSLLHDHARCHASLVIQELLVVARTTKGPAGDTARKWARALREKNVVNIEVDDEALALPDSTGP